MIDLLRHAARLGALACALAAAPAARAEALSYAIDPVHTRVLFSCDHLGFSQALGTFSTPRGTLVFDPDDWSSATVDVRIDIGTLDLGDARWRARMLRADYFDAARHPDARFVSRRVEPVDATRAIVHGDLTLRGITRPLALEVTRNRIGRHPFTLRRTVGFSATATLRRSAFGMDDDLRSVGDTVTLRIEVEATRRRRD